LAGVSLLKRILLSCSFPPTQAIKREVLGEDSDEEGEGGEEDEDEDEDSDEEGAPGGAQGAGFGGAAGIKDMTDTDLINLRCGLLAALCAVLFAICACICEGTRGCSSTFEGQCRSLDQGAG
jgi:hypothetical protein